MQGKPEGAMGGRLDRGQPPRTIRVDRLELALPGASGSCRSREAAKAEVGQASVDHLRLASVGT